MDENDITIEEFINAHQLHKNVYLTGMFYSGITIYNQQVRTLNLIYFLTKKGLIKKAKDSGQIVIIGGGMSGLTAAIAFKKLGYKVTILEEKSLLLHLQHGCTTRQIHPNLFLWPRLDSLKPYTELPFANWRASDAASIEKTLSKEFERERSKEKIEVVCGIDGKETRISLSPKRITYKKEGRAKTLSYELILLATGFGLETYVGRKEITKSYWRNEDLGQMRLGDQVKKFLISGVGDGGVSDVFRLALTGFDPVEMAKAFEEIKREDIRLIEELRKIEEGASKEQEHNYYEEFGKIYSLFSNELVALIEKVRRSDIDGLYLNGKFPVTEIFVKGKMSFINAWILFVLYQQKLFEYREGEFPNDCGEFLFKGDSEQDCHVIVRHGTERNKEQIVKLNGNFEIPIEKVKDLQKKKEYNAFSMKSRWELEYWNNIPQGKYSPKRYLVSSELESYCSVFLTTLEGIILNFARERIKGKVGFRMTLHRLACYSDQYYFQQLANYVGNRIEDRKGGDPGRAFPIDQGIVGLSMRTNTCCSLIRRTEEEGRDLFNYEKIFARRLSKGVKSFFAIPIPSLNKNAALVCLYIDTDEEKLVLDEKFRQLIYWSMTSFVKGMESKNVEEREVSDPFVLSKENDKLKFEESMPQLVKYNHEIESYWEKGELIMNSNRLIDIYAK